MDLANNNLEALKAIEKENFPLAQSLLRQNVKRFPNHATFNNLGAFYYIEGMYRPDIDRMINADKISLRYLLKAEQLGYSDENAAMLAKIWYKEGKYSDALEKYQKILQNQPSSFVYANIGACHQEMNDFHEAAQYFKKSLSLTPKDNRADFGIFSNYSSIYYSYIFALYKSDISAGKKAFKKLLGDDFDHNIAHEFVMAYLLKKFNYAKKIVPILFEKFFVPLPEMGMIFQLFFDLDRREEAKFYLEQQIKHLEGYDYSTKKEIAKLKEVYIKSVARKEVISSYKKWPPFFELDYYIKIP